VLKGREYLNNLHTKSGAIGVSKENEQIRETDNLTGGGCCHFHGNSWDSFVIPVSV
jgi:hypothetical protein